MYSMHGDMSATEDSQHNMFPSVIRETEADKKLFVLGSAISRSEPDGRTGNRLQLVRSDENKILGTL
jgi:hypothetical protein